MKKFTLFLLTLFATAAFAQDPVKRPENVGIGDFDTFKNTSFDSQDESIDLNKNANKLDQEIKGYAGVLSTISVPKLKADLAALREIHQSQKALRQKLGSLDEQGKTLVSKAKEVTPKLKVPQATGNTNKSIKALEATRKNLDGVTGLITSNSKLLIDELKKRGETVEVFD
jgi:Skp family chaperone for outer membrane proteins